jgi:hypothetical protein
MPPTAEELAIAKKNGRREGKMASDLDNLAQRFGRRTKSCDAKFNAIFAKLDPDAIANSIIKKLGATRLNVNGQSVTRFPRIQRYGKPVVIGGSAAIILSELTGAFRPAIEKIIEHLLGG